MNSETLLKYLKFLQKESLRHQNDKKITDDEIQQFEIEINRFIEKVFKTSFSEEIKKVVLSIDFNLDEENHNKSKFKWLNFIGGFEGKEIKNQLNRKNRFEKLYNDIDASIFKIKTLI
ncbi:hypothetical protein H9W90_12230 [Polaribacter pectinis]|uniref:Uncharacterized protein n=1 Tax=Polaribacter pectinis TaxID=2738844 RepID=A0A7G9L8K4_9FLAO|nr:hypothetical protein [Polaribacter pectinis]QNM84953.1 hypothetical protein H9W90_12230 [Polaribacter pectinis]